MNDIDSLDNAEKLCILNILKEANVPYTKNTNGYFFKTTKISNDTRKKLKECLDLIYKNRKSIKQINDERQESVQKYKTSIEEALELKKKEDYDNFITKYNFIPPNKNVSLCIEPIQQQYQDPDILIAQYVARKAKIIKCNRVLAKLNLSINKQKRHTKAPDSSSNAVEDADDNEGSIADDDIDLDSVVDDVDDDDEVDFSDIDQDESIDGDDNDSIILLDPSVIRDRIEQFKNILSQHGYTFNKVSDHDILAKQEYL